MSDEQLRALESICWSLLMTLGEDPAREGLRDTPKRWAAWWKEFLDYQPGNMDTTFESVQTDQMVVVKKIPIWSLCEHHLLPFSCEISIGYIAKSKVLGLSKFARITQKHAHKLQIQERLVSEIADEIEKITSTNDVAVYAEGVHLCMQMRGIRSPGTLVTSVMRGCFRKEVSAREEFLSIVRG